MEQKPPRILQAKTSFRTIIGFLSATSFIQNWKTYGCCWSWALCRGGKWISHFFKMKTSLSRRPRSRKWQNKCSCVYTIQSQSEPRLDKDISVQQYNGSRHILWTTCVCRKCQVVQQNVPIKVCAPHKCAQLMSSSALYFWWHWKQNGPALCFPLCGIFIAIHWKHNSWLSMCSLHSGHIVNALPARKFSPYLSILVLYLNIVFISFRLSFSFLEAIASLVVTFTLSQSVTQSLSQSLSQSRFC